MLGLRLSIPSPALWNTVSPKRSNLTGAEHRFQHPLHPNVAQGMEKQAQ